MSDSKNKVRQDGNGTILEDLLEETIQKHNDLSQNMAAMIANSLTVDDKSKKTKPAHGMQSFKSTFL